MMWKSLSFILLLAPSCAWITTKQQTFQATSRTVSSSHHHHEPYPFLSPSTPTTITKTDLSMASGGADSSTQMGLNELQTLLRDAAQSQDFLEAGRLSDILATRLYGDMTGIDDDTKRMRRRKMSWRGLGAAPWLVDRLDSINYTFPTTIQINAMEAVNSILNTTSEMVESTSLEERMGVDNMNMGIVISGNTGSGTCVCVCRNE